MATQRLLGGYVSNEGIVTAKLGKIALGAGEKITLDFVGDGLMTVSVPNYQLNASLEILMGKRSKVLFQILVHLKQTVE